MYLKTIKLAGFKSFVDSTLIPIHGSMNAIVGPNGCGKSNVVDAVRWVIGETSAKQLRGQSMSDVIFNGTTSRKPVGKASVELHFNNSEGRIGGEYAKYGEIAIRREVERDGQSNYFINGAHVRRRDVVDVFWGTGLGLRSYAIVEQGMISNLIEAKPEELRVYIEETAGISKYKGRRRETENRMRHTQENLDRVNDIAEELAKQLRHLKRQTNVVERYKAYKQEERSLSAQVKVLQWKVLDQKLLEYDQGISQKNIRREEKQSEQHRVETEIEKMREQLTDINEKHNAVQKHYYGLGAEISLLEQQIKDTKEKIHQWQSELEENENVWEELQNNTAECEAQITELETEIEYLKHRSSDIHSIAAAASQELAQAESNMTRWQEAWEAFQAKASQTMSQLEVIQTKREHAKRQLTDLEKRKQQLQQNLNQLQLDELLNEIAPLFSQSKLLNVELSNSQLKLQLLAEAITSRRETNQTRRNELQTKRRELQALEARAVSLEAMQKAALGESDGKISEWFSRQQLKENPRLGQKLVVNPGWEIAVETVLSGYFDAICVDAVLPFLNNLTTVSEGRVTLIEKKSIAATAFDKAPTLASQVDSEWPFQQWLAGIYIADSLDEAKQLQSSLQENESVITKEGLWLGPHWARILKLQDAPQSGFLFREQQLKQLKENILGQQKKCDEQETQLKSGEHQLNQLETDRDILLRTYQKLNAESTTIQSALSTRQAQLYNAQQQQNRLKIGLNECEQQLEQCQRRLTLIKNKASSLDDSQRLLATQREEMIRERDHYRNQLIELREKAHQKRKESDEFEIRLASNEDQLTFLRQTIVRDRRQLKQLTERREMLSQYLLEGDKPLEELDEKLEIQLEQRLTLEAELREVEKEFQEANQLLRDLEEKRTLTQKALNEAQAQLEELRMQRQTVSVRQTTIKEQLNENDFDLEQVMIELPEEATIENWQEKLDQLVERIQRIGPINLAAIEEYETVNERKNYLDKQYADLTKALEILKNAIHKIDRETRAKFEETYDKVNQQFQSLFPRIFGGGLATLEMTDTDLLTAGVIVRAKPPGKRNVTIHMLSGGEKALTAVALVFSLFQLNPAPFCILDEVDASLDDINVGRFCQLVKEMSKEIQFLIISHNKVTIEMADYLMGVTMQEPGVSRVVSVNMQEAIGLVEA
ncbi:chromosome segregation protein SMC [Coxiella endosymbiont of Ornithodoros amblus]|uniref:chromosome segregation protein SMC n=1 Tax=Coxiella endosymbiont of Ornithodoros amblus TaxID=1656166 RepID=UPI00244D9B01|nr:chromosome segregation protein SMC [Coxiella endosymbiont of Ornithodoros amblus]MBW5802569.1 chromosome segregation protein SMC [Coxiella endosymbiont of Ornithodoros amblus]